MNQAETELILNPDGSVYHLHLKDEHIADNVILVGDPGRVELISSFFDSIDCKISNREFTTHTGSYKGKRVSAISTGIGTDNIDIVVNELDAAINIDAETKQPKEQLRKLNLIRLGTCGALQEDLMVDSFLITECSLGIDGVRYFYNLESSPFEKAIETAFIYQCNWKLPLNRPYATMASPALLKQFDGLGKKGITVAANGFFGPQGRFLRIPLRNDDTNAQLTGFRFKNLRIVNYEMESSALYALGQALGHNTICICVIIGNRLAGKFSKNYHPAVEKLVKATLDKCSDID